MAAMAERIDFEAEGLLEGLTGAERESRLALLERLAGDGVPLEELRAAVEEGRLAVLPIEHQLAGEPRYSLEDVAERAGVPVDFLSRQLRSLGVAVPGPDEPALSKEDLDQAHRAKLLLDSGLEPGEIAELGRTIAVAMSQFAAASRQVMATAFARPEDTEHDIAERIGDHAESLIPLVGPTMDYVYRLHLREQLRHAAFAAGDLRGREAPASETITVGFADLVGYTELGQSVPPEELGRVTGRLDELAREVATGPVRLVKLIGDAAMLASPDTEALIEAMFDLLEGMEGEDGEGEEGARYPVLRAGIARGDVLSRGGDYYGAAVNLASRITDAARPGSVLVSKEVMEEVAALYDFSDAGRKHLKGISGTVHVFRCREPEHDEEDGEEDGGDEDRAHRPGRRRSKGRRARRRR
jgi:adenylate cyclase